MENQVKRKRGGQIKYHTEEERKAAIGRSKTKYMLDKPWNSEKRNKTYCLAYKWTHLKTKCINHKIYSFHTIAMAPFWAVTIFYFKT